MKTELVADNLLYAGKLWRDEVIAEVSEDLRDRWITLRMANAKDPVKITTSRDHYPDQFKLRLLIDLDATSYLEHGEMIGKFKRRVEINHVITEQDMHMAPVEKISESLRNEALKRLKEEQHEITRDMLHQLVSGESLRSQSRVDPPQSSPHVKPERQIIAPEKAHDEGFGAW